MFLLEVVSQASFLFMCGQMKTEVFEYDDVKHQSNIIYYYYCACSVRDAVVFPSFWHFCVDR